MRRSTGQIFKIEATRYSNRKPAPPSKPSPFPKESVYGLRTMDFLTQGPSFWKLTKVKGGSWVPARIWIERVIDLEAPEPVPGDPETDNRIAPDRICAEINGDPIDIHNPPYWPFWREIDAAEWQYLTDLCAWARRYSPNHPAAQPDIPASLIERDYI